MSNDLQQIWILAEGWVIECLPTFYAALAATSISVLMGIHDNRTAARNISGSLVCGIITLTVGGSLELFGFPDNAVTFIGAAIGLAGAESIRSRVMMFARKESEDTKKK